MFNRIAQLETDVRQASEKAKALLESTMQTCQTAVVKAATATEPAVVGRLMTPEEKAAIQAILDEGKAAKSQLDRARGDANMSAEIARLTEGMSSAMGDDGVEPTSRILRPGGGGFGGGRAIKSVGQQFVESAEYRAFIKGNGHRSTHAWSSPAIEIADWMNGAQATLLDTTSGSGGPLITPDYRPGIQSVLFRRLMVADLIAPGTTDSNAIIYMKETTATNAAAATTEGAAKPESALVFAQATDPVQKIATWIPVTEEMMEDYPAMASYLDARLRLFVQLAEEDELLNGSGTPPHIRGIMNRVGLTTAQARGSDTNIDALFKSITTLSSTVFVMPDGWVMNPANWQTAQLLKNANGNYLGYGPWTPPSPPMLWGLPGAITPAIAANTALVGAFRTQAQFFRKGGLRVESSNSHASYFVENKIAIRAEERGALCVYREAAFQKVTGLN